MDFWKIENDDNIVEIKWSHNCFEDYRKLAIDFYKCGYKTFEEVIDSGHDNVSTVKGILQNEKYIGDALLQKTIATDFIKKTRIKNDGTMPQYYVKDNHEAIIPRDIFTQVQERRDNMTSGRDGQKSVYTSVNMHVHEMWRYLQTNGMK